MVKKKQIIDEIEEEEKIEKAEKKEPADIVRNIFKELVPYIIIIFVVALVRMFIVTPVRVNGKSMDPYLKEGEILILNKMDSSYDRFDIVVVDIGGTKIIKRVIGLPGENVEYKKCKLYINGEEMKDFVNECITDDFSLEELYNYVVLPENYYFVMGDNRKGSSDSRDIRIGLIEKSQIQGTVSFRLTPFKKFGKLK